MPVTVVVDTQFGDGGKGKLVDFLAQNMEIVVRFGGGANAGYTIVVDDQTHKLHLLPAGILHEGVVNVVGPAVFYDLAIGHEEILLGRAHGAVMKLDYSTPVVLPLHRAIDLGREVMAGGSAIGTTKRGIGPAASDFALRRGLTLGDLRSRSAVKEALSRGGYWDEMIALARHLRVPTLNLSELALGIDPTNFQETVNWSMKYAPLVCEHLADTRSLVHHAYADGKKLLFQAVNGALLDVYGGTRPYCTSSICTAAGVSASFGIYKFDRVIGIVKAYFTRVGGGPFPTELRDALGDELRERGHEYGTTTGRPRRCGWLDLPALRYGCRMSGATELAVTKLDVLSEMPTLKVCESYGFKDELTTLTAEVLAGVTPQYASWDTWGVDLSRASTYFDFPLAAQRYLGHISDVTGLPITAVGTGPERSQLIWI